MTLDTGPATDEGTKGRLKLAEINDDLSSAVAATNAFVRRLPRASVAVDLGLDAWPADLVEGATMLAARLYRRRNSPAGVETFGDQGPVYVQRNDPDVALLLGLGSYESPAVG